MAEGLNKRQQLFIAYYCESWNATEAARRAGYSAKAASVTGYDNLRNPKIKAEIDRRIAEIMPKGEVVQRLAAMARADFTDFSQSGPEAIVISTETRRHGKTIMVEQRTITRNVVRLDLEKAAQLHKLGLIKKYKIKTDGSVEVEFHDAQAALDKLAKMHGLYNDKDVSKKPEDQQPYDDQALAALQQKLLGHTATGAAKEDTEQSHDG